MNDLQEAYSQGYRAGLLKQRGGAKVVSNPYDHQSQDERERGLSEAWDYGYYKSFNNPVEEIEK